MVFQDGEAYVNDDGPVKAAKIFDDLIHNEEMPITIGIFVSPGLINQTSTRADEYVATGDVYARFLLEEIIPEVSKDYRLVNDRDGRAICGMSDGGLCAFAVAWQRTDIFSKVICHIASFARHIEGADFPHLVRKTRNSPKPLREYFLPMEKMILIWMREIGLSVIYPWPLHFNFPSTTIAWNSGRVVTISLTVENYSRKLSAGYGVITLVSKMLCPLTRRFSESGR